jgi:hypothetical protein
MHHVVKRPNPRIGARLLTFALVAALTVGAPVRYALAAAAEAPSPAPSAIGNWNQFYATHVEAAYRFLGGFLAIFAVLYVLSGLTSSFFVPAKALEWRPVPLAITRFLGGLLIVATAAFLPIYAMFKVFTPGGTATTCALITLLVLFAGIAALFAWSQTGSGRRETERRTRRERLIGAVRAWPQFLGSLGLVFAASVILWFAGLNQPYPRLLISYAVLAALGVITTAVSFGQNCRIQVDAKASQGKGERDAAATEYLLARLQTVGLEQPRDLDVVRPSKALGELASSDLSATPAGQIVGTLARIGFALRPGLTWRAVVTIVDDERLAMALSRNGRLVATAVFSRQDVGLRAVDADDPASVSRARAQLLTGAAAFVLLELADVYPKHRAGLYGATQWLGVVLEVIASSKSLSDTEDVYELIRRATNLDPENLEAQFIYIRLMMQKYTGSPLAEAIAVRQDELRDLIVSPSRPAYEINAGDEGLALRILYYSVSDWLTLAVSKPLHERLDALSHARSSLERLKVHVESGAKAWSGLAKSVRRQLKNLELLTEVLQNRTLAQRPFSAANPVSPVLAYNYACYESQRLAEIRRLGAVSRSTLGQAEMLDQVELPDETEVLDLLIGDLAFALSTEETKDSARQDPFFAPVRDEQRFLDLLYSTPAAPRAFLGLKPFAGYAGALGVAGLDTAVRFAAANATPEQRGETVKYLQTLPATVERMYQLATIGGLDRELGEPCMLYLLMELGIRSPEDLQQRVAMGEGKFVGELRSLAARCGLAGMSAVAAPDGWLKAVKARRGSRADPEAGPGPTLIS